MLYPSFAVTFLWVGLVHLLTPQGWGGQGRGAATAWGCCFLHCFSTYWCTPAHCPREQRGVRGRNFGWLEQFGNQDVSPKSQGSKLMSEIIFSSLSVCQHHGCDVRHLSSGHLYCTCFFLPSALQHLQRE